MNDLDNTLTSGLLQNPSTTATDPFFIDSDPSLSISPLRIQLPRNIMMQMMHDDLFHVWWMACIPWQMKAVSAEERVNVDVSVEFVAPRDRAQGSDLLHSTVRLNGTFTNDINHFVSPVTLYEGDSVKVDLFIGKDLIWHNNLSCDIQQTETVTPESISWKILHSKNDHWKDSERTRVSTGCCVWNVAYFAEDDCYRVYSVEYICEIIPHK